MTSPQVSVVILRRVGRVLAREGPKDIPEEILDDIFVLWRAFESSWPAAWTESGRKKVALAIENVLRVFALSDLPHLKRFISSLRAIERSFHREDFEAWFNLSSLSDIERLKSSVVELVEQVAIGRSLQSRHFALLGSLFYGARNAIFHPSLETDVADKSRLLSPLRSALCELTLAFAATQVGISLSGVQEQLTVLMTARGLKTDG